MTATPRFAESNSATFTDTNRACGNAVFDAVVKSVQRVPIPITRSASAASRFAASVPVAPTAPASSGSPCSSDPRPACVSPTGMPVAATNRASASVASL